jgi:glycosyltransferase involved in cell wall biosynthesis
MTAMRSARARAGRPRVLFVQAADVAAYPPIIHASSLMAEAGWRVRVLSMPIAGMGLEFPCQPDVDLRLMAPRPSHIVTRAAYAAYVAEAAVIAVRWRPNIVYASDPLGAGPGLLAARLANARLIYHEHDTPHPGMLRPSLARLRRSAARRAAAVIFPNETRASIAQEELGFFDHRLHIVWNMPRRREMPRLQAVADVPLLLYYHGSVSSVRLPEGVIEAVRQLGGRVRLLIAGYEAPGAAGYVKRILQRAQPGQGTVVRYLGPIAREALLDVAAAAHVGLTVIPRCGGSSGGEDLNLRHLTGASNKAFDYMAAGLALLVSDLPDWRSIFVAPGYALPCDPANPDSVRVALGWFIDHKEVRREMGVRGRARIASDWNYDTAFYRAIGPMIERP